MNAANDNARGWATASSAAFGEALAAELPAILGRANAIAPNRVQNGSQRGEDPGCGSRRRRLAVEAVRKLAALWAQGARRECVAWCLWYVRISAERRDDAAARRVHLLSLEREERIALLLHTSGPEARGTIASGRARVDVIASLFESAPEVDSGGSWLSELVELVDGAAEELARDERAATQARAARRASKKTKPVEPTAPPVLDRSTCALGEGIAAHCPTWRARRARRVTQIAWALFLCTPVPCANGARWAVQRGRLMRSRVQCVYCGGTGRFVLVVGGTSECVQCDGRGTVVVEQ